MSDGEYIGGLLREYLERQRGNVAVVDYRRLLGPVGRAMYAEGALARAHVQRLLAHIAANYPVVEAGGARWELERVEKRKRIRLIYRRLR